jgi:UDP-N-acetylmuramate--alanine ligase
MLGEAAIAAELDPTVIAGSRVPAFANRNIYIGHGEWFILEACEYRRSFLNLTPFGAVLLNCEPDHLDYYKDEKDYVSAFVEFVSKIPKEGFLIFNADDKNCNKLAKKCAGKAIAIKEADIKKMDFDLRVPGDFNKSNATHAAAAAAEMGGGKEIVKKALESFTGTARRLEFRGEKKGVGIYDDYAHHPTEIKASLKTMRDKCGDKKIICVYQPHQYSRTYAFLDELKNSFGDADMVLIPNIYAARDTAEDMKKISAEKLVSLINKTGGEKAVWTKDFPSTVKMLENTTKPSDTIIVMGAGDIYKVADMILG